MKTLLALSLLLSCCTQAKEKVSFTDKNQDLAPTVFTRTNARFFVEKTDLAEQLPTLDWKKISDISDRLESLHYSLDDEAIRDRLVPIEEFRFSGNNYERTNYYNNIHFYHIYHDPIETQNFYSGLITVEYKKATSNLTFIFVSNLSASEKLYQETTSKDFYIQNIRYQDDRLYSGVPSMEYSYRNMIIEQFFTNTDPSTSNQAPVLYIVKQKYTGDQFSITTNYRYSLNLESFPPLTNIIDPKAH